MKTRIDALRHALPTGAAAVVLLLAVFVCYGDTVRGGFVFDDIGQVVENRDLRDVSNIPSLFTKGVWDPSHWNAVLYRPLAFASWCLEYAAAGPDPAVFHTTNIVLHFACTMLVFLLLVRLTGARLPSLAGAVLFAVHPVHSEAVSWVSCRMELMYTLFSLSALLLIMKRPDTRRTDAAAAFLFLLALLSKEAAAAFPGVVLIYILLYDLPDKDRLRYTATRLFPFIAVLAVYAAARGYAVGTVKAGAEVSVFYGVPPYFVFLTMCKALAHYIRLMFFPFNLTVDYIFPPVNSFFHIEVVMPVVLVTASVYYYRRIAASSRPAALALGMFLVMLVPVSNIILLPNIMSERALYMPSIGLSIAVAELLSRLNGTAFIAPAVRKAYAYVPLVAAVFLFGALTVDRNAYWYDPEVFANEDMARLQKRIEMFPDHGPYYKSYAKYAMELGRLDAGTLEAVDRAVELMPDDPGARQLLDTYHGMLLVQGGGEGREAEEASSLDRAATLLYNEGRFDQADDMIEKAIRLEPENALFYVKKGVIAYSAGNPDLAVRMFDKAEELDHDNTEAYLQHGIVLGNTGRFSQAAEKLVKAAELAPDRPDVRYYLAAAYVGLGLNDMAKAQLERALELEPGYRDALALRERLK